MTNFGHSTTGAKVVEAFKGRLKGKIVLITGPSDGGIGAETAISLAKGSPALIILAGRSISRIQPVIDRISSTNSQVQAKFINLDLSSQASVREAAANINASVDKIDIVINNAAIMACPFATTVDGIESQFGTNYIGHFLLTNLVMSKILAASPDAKIVNVSSSAHRMADVRLRDWNFEDGTTYHSFQAYGSAKTAIILFTVALASKLREKGVGSIALHPGSIRTNLQTHMTPKKGQEAMDLILANTGRPFPTPEPKSLAQGCSTTLVAALDPELPSGSYLEDCRNTEPEPYAKDDEKALQLWALSEDLVGQNFRW